MSKEARAVRRRVVLEPDLQVQVMTMGPEERLELARQYFRWAKQLYVYLGVLISRNSTRDGRTGKESRRVRNLVVLEPQLEMQVQAMGPMERLELGRLYYRWAKQLYVSLGVLAPQHLPSAPRRLRRPAPRLQPLG